MRLCAINHDPEDCPLQRDCRYWSRALGRCTYSDQQESKGKSAIGKVISPTIDNTRTINPPRTHEDCLQETL